MISLRSLRPLVSLFLIASVSGSPVERAPEPAAPEPWWPSEWGPEDQRGAYNRLGPDDVLRAASLIRSGQVYELGRVYEPRLAGGARRFELTIPGLPTAGPLGEIGAVYNDELVVAHLGQIGTQFDGLGHMGQRVGGEDLFYNGFKLSEFGRADGLRKLGVENVGAFFTRGLLLDIAALKGRDRLEPGYEITAADLEEAERRIGATVDEGDAVLIRTGHGALWLQPGAAKDGWAGIGMDAARWLSDRKIALVGSDTPSTEVLPHVDPARPWEVHLWLLMRHGIYNLENLDLESLGADGAGAFAFVFTPLKLQGATGSPGNPLAIR